MDNIKNVARSVAKAWTDSAAWLAAHPNVTLAVDVLLIILLALSLIKV